MLDTESISSTDPRKFPETSIVKIIPKMIDQELFELIPEDIQKYMEWSYQKSAPPYNYKRPVKITIPKFNKMMTYGKRLFDFEPEKHLVDKYLTDLQNCVNKLVDGVIVE